MDKNAQRKWLLTSAFLIAVSILFLFVPRERNRPADDENKIISSDQALTIKTVIDGDTFELSDGRIVRIIGVDTPETGEPFYLESIAFVDSILSSKTIRIEYDKEDTDRYGRILAYLYTDEGQVNQMIIAKGFGLVYLFKNNIKYADKLIRGQKKARTLKSGIWSLPGPSPEEYYLHLKGSFRFHRPLCHTIKNSNKNNYTRYSSRDALLDKGISPCRNCRP